jgi:hypothetical protein
MGTSDLQGIPLGGILSETQYIPLGGICQAPGKIFSSHGEKFPKALDFQGNCGMMALRNQTKSFSG